MSKSLAALSCLLTLAITFFYPSDVAAADPLPSEKTSEMALFVLPPTVSRQEAMKALAIGKRPDASTKARLGAQAKDASRSTPAPSPYKKAGTLPGRAKAQAATAAKPASSKLALKDCIGSGTAYTPEGLYKSRWSWCQTHTVGVYSHVNGVVVGLGFFDVTLIGEGIKGSRTAKVWQYITNVKISGEWPPSQPTVRFTIPCGGWPTAKNCQTEGGQTILLATGIERLISYKYTSSTSGADGKDKVGIGTFKPQYVLTATGATRYGYGQGFRCDSATYLGKNGACVFDRLRGTFKLSRSDKAVDQAAKHIYDALRGASNIYPGKGKTIPSILTRTMDAKKKAANTAKAKAACKKKWPKKPAGKDCDEYPFKSTEEGAAKGDGKFSVRYITSGDNQRAGSRLNQFYTRERILDGEKFQVRTSA